MDDDTKRKLMYLAGGIVIGFTAWALMQLLGVSLAVALMYILYCLPIFFLVGTIYFVWKIIRNEWFWRKQH